ncbi:excalibur calcium-binding domain-containing protein [Streptomyces sp. NBC_00838]|uniref:excalibur calcium-binding domain-containing protein n=1 Tax=Streptomyces sp. NBC_00838 TaxID=2903680 RepID=UPI00386B397A|nr:excalibur calcium-binding domain-containing protein [Streptomyces sp. NBC_00838]
MSFSPPAAPGPNPYVGPPAPPSGRPKWTRKRVLLPLLAVLFFLGVAVGAADGTAGTKNAADAKPAPAATVTATATASPEPAVTETVTATPEPAPTVTKTKTVRVTVAPAAEDNGDSGGSGGSGTGGSGGGSTYYANCTAVRAAGAAPIRSGDPGYGSHLDRDGDGVACE